MNSKKNFKHRLIRRRALALVGMVLAVCNSASANWEVAPALRLQSGHDSNLRLTTEDPDRAWSNTLSVDALIGKTTERSELRASVGVGYNNYLKANDETKDRFTQQATLAFRTNGPRVAFQFSGTANKQDLIRTSRFSETELDPITGEELDDFINEPVDLIDDNLDLETPEEDNTVVSQINRLYVRAAPSVQFKLSRRNRLRVGVDYSRRKYGNDNNQLQDSHRYGPQVEYARDINERNILSVRGAVSFFRPNRNLDSEIYEAGISWRSQISQRLRVDAQIGLVQVESNTASDTGGKFGLSAQARLQNTRIIARLARGFQPTAFGNVSRTDLAELKLNRSFSNKASGGVRVRYQARRRTIDTNQTGDDLITDRVRVSAGLLFNYRLSGQWSIGSNYDYRWIKRDNSDRMMDDNTNAKGHAVFTTITFRPALQESF